MDEHAQGMITQVFNKILLIFDYLTDNIGQEHILPLLSLVATVGLILGVGYCMSYYMRMEEEKILKRQQFKNGENAGGEGGANPMENKTVGYVQELKLHDLRAEKYNGLVRLLKPGCRTIVLVTDLQSRANLMPAYHSAVWPYRKYCVFFSQKNVFCDPVD